MTTSSTDTILAAAPQILILGATGPTGRHLVGQALARGYDITVLVRSPERSHTGRERRSSLETPAT